MRIIFGIMALLFFFCVPGWVMLRFLLGRKLISLPGSFERIFAGAAFSVLITSLGGFALAILGIFSIYLLFIVCLVVGIVFVLLSFGNKLAASEEPPVAGLIFFGVAILIAVALWHDPFSYIFGGWDPGVYTNTGVHLARTGEINYTDDFFASLPENRKMLFTHHRQYIHQRFPGFLLADLSEGKIQPQFHHLYPVWIAVFYSLFGIKFALFVNVVFGFLSIMALYFLCGNFFSREVGIVATLLLLLNVAQLWQVRFQTSEVMTQFFLLLMIYMSGFFFREENRWWGLFSVLAFGCALFTRYDTLLYLPLVMIGLYLMALSGRARSTRLPASGLAVVLLWFILYKTITPLYLPLWGDIRPYMSAIIGAVAIAVILAVIFWFAFKKYGSAISEFFSSSGFRWSVVALIALLAIYAYFVRPEINHTMDGKNFVALGWFMSPWGLGMMVAGAGIFILKVKRLDQLLLLLMGAVSSIVYIHSRLNDDFYMWTVRRYIPLVIPLFAVLISYFIITVSRKMKRAKVAVIVVLALVTAVPPLVRGKAVIAGNDYRELEDFIDEFASDLDPEGIYICDGYWLAQPLNLMYGLNTLVVSDVNDEKIKKVTTCFRGMVNRNKNVYYIGKQPPRFGDMLASDEIKTSQFHTRRIQHSRFLPRKLEQRSHTFKLFKVRMQGCMFDQQ